jgi:hypothetical protein
VTTSTTGISTVCNKESGTLTRIVAFDSAGWSRIHLRTRSYLSGERAQEYWRLLAFLYRHSHGIARLCGGQGAHLRDADTRLHVCRDLCQDLTRGGL